MNSAIGEGIYTLISWLIGVVKLAISVCLSYCLFVCPSIRPYVCRVDEVGRMASVGCGERDKVGVGCWARGLPGARGESRRWVETVLLLFVEEIDNTNAGIFSTPYVSLISALRMQIVTLTAFKIMYKQNTSIHLHRNILNKQSRKYAQIWDRILFPTCSI